jgi:hypothetical protein
MGNYIMCQFPLRVGAHLQSLPHYDDYAEDQPDCEYDSQMLKVTVWTKEIPSYYGVDYQSRIDVRLKTGEVLSIPIPYWAGKQVQYTSQGLCHKNGVKYF